MSPSRQRLWQRQRIENGQCPLCSDPLNLYATLCDNCMAKEQIRKGHKPWEPGKPGRPPKNKFEREREMNAIEHRKKLIEILANLRDAVNSGDAQFLKVSLEEATSTLDDIAKELWGMTYADAVKDSWEKAPDWMRVALSETTTKRNLPSPKHYMMSPKLRKEVERLTKKTPKNARNA